MATSLFESTIIKHEPSFSGNKNKEPEIPCVFSHLAFTTFRCARPLPASIIDKQTLRVPHAQEAKHAPGVLPPAQPQQQQPQQQQQQHYALLFCPNTPARGRQQPNWKLARAPRQQPSQAARQAARLGLVLRSGASHVASFRRPGHSPLPAPPPPCPLPPRPSPSTAAALGALAPANSRESSQIPGKRLNSLDRPYKNRVKAGPWGPFLNVLAIPAMPCGTPRCNW